jgi:hypothetical protein
MRLRIRRTGPGRVVRVVLFSLVLLALVLPSAYAASHRVWLRRYNGPGNQVDSGAVVAIDSKGYVYVGGRSTGSGTGEDYVLIKYGGYGGVKWVQRYDGPAGGWDGIRAIAIDKDDNIYVTGRSFGSGSHGDYATIKYDSNGNQKWVKRYSSGGYNDDGAMDMGIDSYGNVIVTGFSTGSGSAFDFVTIKYGADGTVKWTKRYDGPGNGGDIARGLVVDPYNNVYVTGPSKGDGTDFDYCTIKYSPAGEQLWIMRWNSPFNRNDGSTDIALDALGFPYVTGYSYRNSTNCDYITVKYNRNGTTAWVNRYEGPGAGPDVAWAVDVDGNGVYVTGSSYGKGTNVDYATIRYTRWGTTHWVRRFSGPGAGEDVANDVAAKNNKVYVTGYSTGSSSKGDFMTVAYGAGGWYLWSDRYNGPGNAFDQGNAVIINPRSGDVYATGGSGGSGSRSDIATMKYLP